MNLFLYALKGYQTKDIRFYEKKKTNNLERYNDVDKTS